mgnify:CR=1 FL=1
MAYMLPMDVVTATPIFKNAVLFEIFCKDPIKFNKIQINLLKLINSCNVETEKGKREI